MICEACAAAADWPDAVDRIVPWEAQLLRRQAHDACQGGTWCDCQHRISSPDIDLGDVPC
jgi:hypothetical protein